MKRYEIQKFGIDELTLVDSPVPSPAGREVLVRVRAVSLNYRDVMMVDGRYNPRMQLPRVPLSDCVGRVEATGPAVTRFAVGDRVSAAFVQGWIDGELTPETSKTALGGPIDGVLAEYVLLSEDGLVATPQHLTDEEAATLPCTGVTSWNALVESGRVREGETVLVQGTGGVAIYALQFAKSLGARVIVTSSSDEKLERARQLGADETINYRATPDWDKAARALTGGAGVDHVVEVGGAGTLNRSLNAARMNGRVSVIGVLSGAGAEIQATNILMKHLTVQGIFVGSRAMFERMNDHVTRTRFRPVIDRLFGFDEAREALRYMGEGKHFGKIVIRVA